MNLPKMPLMNNWHYLADQTFLNKLMFINWQAIFLRLISSNEGRKFTFFQAIVAIEQYGLLLYLTKKYPHTKIVPNQEIDAVLHAHTADALQFNKDCQNLLNATLVHVPEVGIRKEERQEWLLAFTHTQKLFEQSFGHNAMGSSTPACCEILLIT